MALNSLGYFGVRTRSLDDWSSFATKFLGLQLVDRSRKSLTFRMDDRRQRVVVQEDSADAGQAAFMGWEVAGSRALDDLAATVEGAGVGVQRAPKTIVEERRVKELISFEDPIGNRLEAFHGAEIATDPFKPGRAISGFRTGPLGMGHIVLNVERVDQLIPFYQDVLGFHLSDYTLQPFKAYFFHLNPRHHSFAMVETGKNSVHHLMMELFMLDDVGQAYDLALGEENRVATTLGRHSNDFMTSFYANSPSGFFVEYGWGGRSIDSQSWTPVEMTCGPSLWGHDRNWLPPEGRAQARALRRRAAEDGQREPVQVVEGNYTLAPGTCPWWDAARKSGWGAK
jgi:2,3-dihydroxybiphenyl 1,2-dioxygenase